MFALSAQKFHKENDIFLFFPPTQHLLFENTCFHARPLVGAVFQVLRKNNIFCMCRKVPFQETRIF